MCDSAQLRPAQNDPIYDSWSLKSRKRFSRAASKTLPRWAPYANIESNQLKAFYGLPLTCLLTLDLIGFDQLDGEPIWSREGFPGALSPASSNFSTLLALAFPAETKRSPKWNFKTHKTTKTPVIYYQQSTANAHLGAIQFSNAIPLPILLARLHLHIRTAALHIFSADFFPFAFHLQIHFYPAFLFVCAFLLPRSAFNYFSSLLSLGRRLFFAQQ